MLTMTNTGAVPLSRAEEFLLELNRIEHSPEYSFADYLTLLNQPVDELYYLVYFYGSQDDYHYLFEITPLYVYKDQTFLKDIHDIHIGTLENHTEAYLTAFEKASDECKRASIEALQQDAMRMKEVKDILQPWVMSAKYPSVGLYFEGLFGNHLPV